MGLRAPSYTQTPNEIFDEWLPHLKLVEIRVLMVVLRKTFGWHKTHDRISLTQLEKLTGSRRGDILKAVEKLEKMTLLRKHVVGEKGSQNTFYELAVIEPSNNLYQYEFHTPPSMNFIPTKETHSKDKKEKYQKKAPRPKGPGTPPSANAAGLCSFFLKAIQKGKPNYTQKSVPSGWYKHAEAILKHRTVEQMEKLITWLCDPSNFWFANVLSMEKLKKQLDTLEVAYERRESKVSPQKMEGKNRELAKKVIYKYKNLVDKRAIDIGNNYIEFRSGAHCVHLKFSEHGFEEQVRNELRKRGLNIPDDTPTSSFK